MTIGLDQTWFSIIKNIYALKSTLELQKKQWWLFMGSQSHVQANMFCEWEKNNEK